jgi:hypothetical protein
MITYDGMIESLTIFRKYVTSGEEAFPMNPMHDQLYAGPEPELVSAEDIARLQELGWFVEEESFCIFT